jgi:hypothetical protein
MQVNAIVRTAMGRALGEKHLLERHKIHEAMNKNDVLVVQFTGSRNFAAQALSRSAELERHLEHAVRRARLLSATYLYVNRGEEYQLEPDPWFEAGIHHDDKFPYKESVDMPAPSDGVTRVILASWCNKEGNTSAQPLVVRKRVGL